MSFFLTDPKTKEKSVSLTFVVLAFTACMVAGALQIAGKIETVSICMELFYSSASLYFARRFSVKGQEFNASSNGKDNV